MATGIINTLAKAFGGGPKGVSTSDATGVNKGSLIDQVHDWAEQKWDDLKNAYIVYHQLVWLSLLNYAGIQWLTWDNNRKLYTIATPDDDWTPQPTINRFSPAIDGVASICRVPTVECSPTEGHEDDPEANLVAQIARLLAAWFLKENAVMADYKGDEDKAGEAGQWFVMAGGAFTYVEPYIRGYDQVPQMQQVPAIGTSCQQCGTFNKEPADAQTGIPNSVCPACGGPLEMSSTTITQPQIDPATGQPAMQRIPKWSARAEVVNPMEILPRPGCKNMKNMGWGFWAKRLETYEVKKLWNYDATPDSEFIDSQQAGYETELNYYYTGYSNATLATKTTCMVVRAFITPGVDDDWPDGLYGVRVNDQWILGQTWKEAGFTDHPLTKADYLKLPTVFFGRSIAFDLVSIQKELNAYESLIKLHGMTSAADPIVADQNTKISEITGRSDKVIWWRSVGPGAKEPHRMQHGSLDDGIYRQRQQLMSDMGNISGLVDVFRGQQPGSVTSASGISQLRGQAEQTFAKPAENWNALWTETVRKGVKIIQSRMRPEEIAEIVGPNKTRAIGLFLKADLDTCLKWVSSKHGLPQTREEKRQEMLMLYDRKALDVTDVNVREKIYELFGDTGMQNSFNADATRARFENNAMKEGVKPEVMVGIEDLAVHAFIHKEFVKSLEFDELDVMVKQIFIEHIMETNQALAAEQMQQAAMNPEQGPGAGAPAAPPVASPGAGNAGGAGPVTGPPANQSHPAARHPSDRKAVSPADRLRPTGGATNMRPHEVPTGPKQGEKQ